MVSLSSAHCCMEMIGKSWAKMRILCKHIQPTPMMKDSTSSLTPSTSTSFLNQCKDGKYSSLLMITFIGLNSNWKCGVLTSTESWILLRMDAAICQMKRALSTLKSPLGDLWLDGERNPTISTWVAHLNLLTQMQSSRICRRDRLWQVWVVVLWSCTAKFWWKVSEIKI